MIQSTLVISKFKGLSEIVRVIRTSTYQICKIKEMMNRTIIFHKRICKLTPEDRDILKILWKRGEILLFSTIFCYLLLDVRVKTGTTFSLRDKRLFDISEVEITRVDCNFKKLKQTIKIPRRREAIPNDWSLTFCKLYLLEENMILYMYSVVSVMPTTQRPINRRDTYSVEATVCQKCFIVPLKMGLLLKGRIRSKGRKVSPFKVDVFLGRDFVCRNTNRKSSNVPPLSNMAENLQEQTRSHKSCLPCRKCLKI